VMKENCADNDMLHDAGDNMSVPGSVWIVREEMSVYWVNVSTCVFL